MLRSGGESPFWEIVIFRQFWPLGDDPVGVFEKFLARVGPPGDYPVSIGPTSAIVTWWPCRRFSLVALPAFHCPFLSKGIPFPCDRTSRGDVRRPEFL